MVRYLPLGESPAESQQEIANVFKAYFAELTQLPKLPRAYKSRQEIREVCKNELIISPEEAMEKIAG